MNIWEFLAKVISLIASVIVFILFLAFCIFMVGLSIPIYLVVLLICGVIALWGVIWDFIEERKKGK